MNAFLNAKLACSYPSIAMLVNFELDNIKARSGNKLSKDDGDTYAEWLSNFNVEDDSQLLIMPPSEAEGHPPEQLALADGSAEDSQPPEGGMPGLEPASTD